jgi:DNA-binding protein H-NS
MTQSYSQIIEEIESLKRKAETARAKEVAGVVQRMKDAIRVYGITADDLGLNGSTRASAPKAKVEASETKFADQSGNTWAGRGPRPSWLKDAIAAGRSLQDFAVEPPARGRGKAPKSSSTKATKKRANKRAPVPAKYRDDQGNTWSGRGSQPRWLTAALEGGKKLESFAI